MIRNDNTVVKNADFDSKTNTLLIDYLNNPDTSLLQIIELSGIRKTGYGLLLNLDKSYSENEIKSIKLKLQKLDINAIHSFDITTNAPMEKKESIAMEDAMFIWVLDRQNTYRQSDFLGQKISEIQGRKVERILIVINKQD
jgi:hypothetical protein